MADNMVLKMGKKLFRKGFARGVKEEHSRIRGMLMYQMLQYREEGDVTTARLLENLIKKIKQ